MQTILKHFIKKKSLVFCLSGVEIRLIGNINTSRKNVEMWILRRQTLKTTGMLKKSNVLTENLPKYQCIIIIGSDLALE